MSSFGEAIANGGRYDDIGEVFGRARAATGFDADLKILLAQGNRTWEGCNRIYAPAGDDPDLLAAINALRTEGHQVVRAFAGQTDSAQDMGCDHELVKVKKGWEVKPIK